VYSRPLFGRLMCETALTPDDHLDEA
jgi:hypothetical protein